MDAKKHPDYHQEQNRLDHTIQDINQTILSQMGKKAEVDQTIQKTMMHFDSADSENYITMMINTMFQDRMGQRLKNLASSRKKPYFARIDFCEDGTGHMEKVYIGKTSLIREEDQEVIIVDWRAPVANLYYEERLGKAEYHCPEGTIRGDLRLKRQFSVEKGELLDIQDIDITTNDAFLQSYLGANADNRLKDIVSTIQAEQNRVIRADMWNPLIVQGAAGSGKTTIALHRISYLIYTYKKTIRPENFLILAPNKLFLNYISEVLPELGAENVRQTTFPDLALNCLHCRWKMQDPNEKLAFLTDPRVPAAESEQMIKCSLFKSSMDWKRILEAYLHQLEQTYLPEEDFRLESDTVMTREEIQSLFQEEYNDLPFRKRMGRIRHTLQHKVKNAEKQMTERVQKICDQKVYALKQSPVKESDRRQRIIQTIEKKDAYLGQIRRASKSAVKAYLRQIRKRTPLEYYRDFFLSGAFEQLSGPYIDPEQIRYIRERTLDHIHQGKPEMEDLAPLLYLKLETDGLDRKTPIRHIVVDEAQDLSVFQLYLLKRMMHGGSMTILGDLCQGIHSYRGITDWNTVMEEVFQGKCRYLTLKKSYRTTVEIMNAANAAARRLPYDLPPAEPVIRHGQPPEIQQVCDLAELSDKMAKNIRDCRENGLKTIAVLCKTEEECRELGKRIRNRIPDIRLITGREGEYPGGAVLLPVYLAKGLEFDAVLLSNASENCYPEDELHTKVLYVAMTRPLHRLYIYFIGKLSPLLNDLP
jgi:DNA helicase-2/ATP-dependent DNA helicase PcrA